MDYKDYTGDEKAGAGGGKIGENAVILESFGDFKTAVNKRFGKDRMEREF